MEAAAEPVGGVRGRQHPDVVTASEQLLSEGLDVAVDATLIGPGIGGYQRYTHLEALG